MSRHRLHNESRRRFPRLTAPTGAFTFVELLMAMAIAAAFITTAVIIYGTISRNNSLLGTYGTVTLPAGALTSLYGTTTGTTVQAYFAPNFGRTEKAELLRQSLYEDIGHASAVYCLARTGFSTIRPTTITVSAASDARAYDTADAFRQLVDSGTGTPTFTSYRGAPSTSARNLSIFILMPSDSTGYLSVRAVYELDFVNATKPAGTYVSVRRFQGTTFTDYYDIFYPYSSLPTAFSPTVAQFERYARKVTAESNYDPYKVAEHRPFYFVWWPDPAMTTLEGTDSFTTYGASDPRSAYAGMSSRTSLFMVLPMFPAL